MHCTVEPLISIIPLLVANSTALSICVILFVFIQTSRVTGWRAVYVPVFDTYIRVDSGIEWSQDNNAPIMAYKKSSRSATEYMELTKEIAKME